MLNSFDVLMMEFKGKDVYLEISSEKDMLKLCNESPFFLLPIVHYLFGTWCLKPRNNINLCFFYVCSERG